jgi:Flp pilus assembly protein TadG
LNNATRLLACERGSSAVELGIILSAFLSMLFGIINVSMMLWTLASLHYAAETAARCASVGSASCTNASTIEAYALSQYFGLSLGGTNPFTYSATGCGSPGNTVTASYTYSLVIPLIHTYSVPLSATACAP